MASKKVVPIRPGVGVIAGGPWVPTASGGAFDLVAQRPGQVSIRDIAASLAKICRFNGHCTAFYSVAQHSVLVAEEMRNYGVRAQLYGLLHDAHQSYLGRMALPVKELFSSFDVYGARADLENTIQRTIHTGLGLAHPAPEAWAGAIADACGAVFATEWRDLMPEVQRPWPFRAAPLARTIVPWHWQSAEDRFLAFYEDLRSAAGAPSSHCA